jgi:hypothetical protein
MSTFDTPAGAVSIPSRDPERPQDDPWDANAVRYLLGTSGGQSWTRGNLMECLREQGNRRKSQPDKVAEAARLAARHGVERHPDLGGKTIRFFRTDAEAPAPYPRSASERRYWLSHFEDRN